MSVFPLSLYTCYKDVTCQEKSSAIWHCGIVLSSIILCLELTGHWCKLLSPSLIIIHLQPELKFPQLLKCGCIIHLSLYRKIILRNCPLGSNLLMVSSELRGHISSKLEKTFPYIISNLQISVKIRGLDIICALELLKQHKITKRSLIIGALSNDNQAGKLLHSLAVPLSHNDTIFKRAAQ